MRNAFDDWQSFFASLKDYKENPSKYLGRPRIPGYIKSAMRIATFSNQDCTIKNKCLKFPKIKEKLNLGKLGYTNEKLKSVRVIPKYGQFVVEIVFEGNIAEPISEIPKRVMAIDLGIDNLATITTNTGKAPVLLKGKNIKSINQFYNKKRAYYNRILRQGKSSKEGLFSSHRLQNLDALKHRKLKDLFHKASFVAMSIAELEDINTIIIGNNKGWKQNANMGAKNNQRFVGIPFSLLINMIKYKAERVGINIIVTEESYTSKASFLDRDDIPTYGEEIVTNLSGKRISRGLYRTKENQMVNADVNGSADIMRKYLVKKEIPLCIKDVEINQVLSYQIA
ncbi:transposase [Virgibacillus sp. NKC19-16]|uniref:RNA-guided endonuclease InsQ/TnpB family protein n=1 Tax=Virgibacillus salidurans TaxID=2831673 RepID=UPI001F181E15|nr:transposase [Virgibacillus sp. NKC19-16]UJL47376.1 transposase [Virgibacillus sp. NKC19-16]